MLQIRIVVTSGGQWLERDEEWGTVLPGTGNVLFDLAVGYRDANFVKIH